MDLTNDEIAALVAAAREKPNREVKFRFAERLAPLKSALAKLDPRRRHQSQSPNGRHCLKRPCVAVVVGERADLSSSAVTNRYPSALSAPAPRCLS
jgi:hypothetical protein